MRVSSKLLDIRIADVIPRLSARGLSWPEASDKECHSFPNQLFPTGNSDGVWRFEELLIETWGYCSSKPALFGFPEAHCGAPAI